MTGRWIANARRRAAAAMIVFFLTLTTMQSAHAQIKDFNVSAQSATTGIPEFARQAGIQILVSETLVRGKRTSAVTGAHTVADALAILLKGTGLVATSKDGTTYTVAVQSGPSARNSAGAAGVSVASQSGDQSVNASVSARATSESNRGDLEEITVTGTHIRGGTMASPVIEIGQEEIERSGYTSIGDLMLSVPQISGGGYTPGTAVLNAYVNDRYGDNTTGATVPNLRGLGPGSTLTLVDGHRMASGLSGGGADISSIPLDAIERIEIVTDSASSIYGSDAVAGVVNIILKKNYDGAKTSVSYGAATEGGGTVRRASQLFGTDWNGGSVVATYEFNEQAAVPAADRVFSSQEPGPYSLLPQTKSNSLTVSATQNLSAGVSSYFDGLFVARDANSYVTNPGLDASFEQPSTLRKYALAIGADAKLTAGWKLSFFVNAAEDATENDTRFVTPTPYSAGKERQLGKLGVAEANANGPIASLPGGPAMLAVGAGYRQESYSDLLGSTDGSFALRNDGVRNIRYAFGEVSIPLVQHTQRAGLNSLDLVVSGRSERYSDFGEETVPKLGLVYAPAESLKLRSTWGRAFRAPNLNDLDQEPQLGILSLADPQSTTGTSTVLVRSGGNPGLRPETASSWTLGLDYSPLAVDGLQLSTTVFDIRYSNRISQLADPYVSLSDPLDAFFVTRAPSAGAAQALYNSYAAGEVYNATGVPFNADNIAAIVDYRSVNVSRQTARGADLTLSYRMGAESNGALFFLNGAYLDLVQQDTPGSPTEEQSGLAFYPAKLRARGGATYRLNSWALTGTVNYLGRETNTQIDPIQSVGSWTTLDASLRYSLASAGLRFTLAVINLADRNPPHVQAPSDAEGISLDYDSSNASPLGRFVSLSVSKQW